MLLEQYHALTCHSKDTRKGWNKVSKAFRILIHTELMQTEVKMCRTKIRNQFLLLFLPAADVCIAGSHSCLVFRDIHHFCTIVSITRVNNVLGTHFQLPFTGNKSSISPEVSSNRSIWGMFQQSHPLYVYGRQWGTNNLQFAKQHGCWEVKWVNTEGTNWRRTLSRVRRGHCPTSSNGVK